MTITTPCTYDVNAMKKLSSIVALVSYLSLTTSTFAQSIQIDKEGLPGYTDISDFINAAMRMAFIVALLGVLVMLVWGGVAWVISGGEKEAVGEARKRIINALIGLAILAIAFAIAQLAGQFVGVDLLGRLPIPGPTNPTPSLPVVTPPPAAR